MIPSRRRVVHDNIATPSHPVWRARYATPLTPRHVRGHYVEQAMEIPSNQRDAWLADRMTPLDKLLSDDEAASLELYFDCEQKLAGNARSSDYAGDRVMSSRSGGMSPLPDAWVEIIAQHMTRKRCLTAFDVRVLSLFVAQQAGELISDAQAALMLGLPGRKRRKLYVQTVARCARVLSGDPRTAAKTAGATRVAGNGFRQPRGNVAS